jgi:D-xylose transport system ATP-binding protein
VTLSRPLLEMRGIGKTFPGVRALDGVDFDLRAGEIHALVGENGAGKSTLLRVLGGVHAHPSYTGEVRLSGQVLRCRSVRDAEAAGIAVVYQELSLVAPLSVAENIVLGHEPRRRFGAVDRHTMRDRAARALQVLHVTVDPDTPVERLGLGRQQLVEIAKALARDARVLVFDEPTAALTTGEVESLFEALQRLRAQGIAIAYVSHRLGEVFRMADRITVLRDGRTVGSGDTAALDEARVVSWMVGRKVETLFPPARPGPGPVVLDVRHLTVEDPHPPRLAARGMATATAVARRRLLDEVSFSVRAGEVLGIGGLIGAGRTELLMTLFGAAPGRRSGTVAVAGVPVTIRSPSAAMTHGLALLGEDRARLGLFPAQSSAENIVLAALRGISRGRITSPARERDVAVRTIRELGIRPPAPETRAGDLSGGNQQKVLLGRWLLTGPRVLLLDEPTRGVDVGAREEIYGEIDRLARTGLAIVIVSSDLPELMGLSDRVLVLRGGRVAATFNRAEITPEAVMTAAAASAVQ